MLKLNWADFENNRISDLEPIQEMDTLVGIVLVQNPVATPRAKIPVARFVPESVCRF